MRGGQYRDPGSIDDIRARVLAAAAPCGQPLLAGCGCCTGVEPEARGEARSCGRAWPPGTSGHCTCSRSRPVRAIASSRATRPAHSL